MAPRPPGSAQPASAHTATYLQLFITSLVVKHLYAGIKVTIQQFVIIVFFVQRVPLDNKIGSDNIHIIPYVLSPDICKQNKKQKYIQGRIKDFPGGAPTYFSAKFS